jgi:hypothetical protein
MGTRKSSGCNEVHAGIPATDDETTSRRSCRSQWFNGRESCPRRNISAILLFSGGEDLLQERILGERNPDFMSMSGTSSTTFSNTCRFYKRGWRGINIDPNPDD